MKNTYTDSKRIKKDFIFKAKRKQSWGKVHPRGKGESKREKNKQQKQTRLKSKEENGREEEYVYKTTTKKTISDERNTRGGLTTYSSPFLNSSRNMIKTKSRRDDTHFINKNTEWTTISVHVINFPKQITRSEWVKKNSSSKSFLLMINCFPFDLWKVLVTFI